MKRVLKRWGALLLAVVMTLSLLPTAALAAEGDTPTNLAQSKTVEGNTLFVSGVEVNNDTYPYMAVDGNSATRWSGNYMKGVHGTNTATNGSNPSWIVVDLAGDGKVVESITSISMEYYRKVWGCDYKVQVAGNDYTPADFSSNVGFVAATAAAFSGLHEENAACWTTIKTYSSVANSDDPTDTVNAADFETAIPEGTRYLRLYYTKMNGDAGGDAIGLEELTVMGTLKDAPAPQPTVTQYIRHTGAIESGKVYQIFANGYNLHNTTGTVADHCNSPTPAGDKLDVAHADGANGHVTTDHQWIIAGDENNGYTIQGVTEGEQSYLKANGTQGTNNAYKLALSANKNEAVKLTFTPSGNGYKVSYVDGTDTKYLRWSDDGDPSRGWNFSTTENVVQLFKETVIPVTIASATDDSRDVGMTDSGYVNTDGCAIKAWASTQQSDSPASQAVDGNEGLMWHSRYNGTQTDEENIDKNTTSQIGWGKTSLAESMERRWIELDIVGGAQWLSGLRYMGNGGNGYVTACEIRVWLGDEASGAWSTVTSNTAWTIGNGSSWSYKEFDYPVLTSKVRLYGVTTHSNEHDGVSEFMSAKEIRLVKALTEAAPATQTATVTVKGLDGNTIAGVTVSGGGAAATTNESGVATLDLVDGKTHTLTVATEGYVTRKITVSVNGEAVTAEVTLRAVLTATDATHDYPLTNSMVSAVSHNSPGTSADGYAYWAIDYDDSHWWHQAYSTAQDVWFAFALPAEVSIAGIRYQQRTKDTNIRYFGDYEIQTSTDGTTWTTIEGETGRWGDEYLHVHTLAEPQTARYFRVHRTGGNASNVTAKTFQLVLDENACTTVTGTVTADSQPMSGVTVQVYHDATATYKKATTDSNGAYEIVLPRNDGQTWKLVVDHPGYSHAEKTATTSGETDTQNFALATRTLHLTGTVPASATVQLMSGAGRLPVADVAAQTGTNFDFDVTSLTAGTYYLRAWKDGCVPAWKEVTWTAATESLEAVTVADSDLVAVDTSVAYKNYDFSAATQVSEFGSLYGAESGTAAHDSENGAMTLTFTGNGNSSMWANAVGSKDYVLKNGTISFDVTQTAGGTDGRFGLVFLQFSGDGEEAWAFIGQKDNAGSYFAENVKVGGGDDGWQNAANNNGPAMAVGLTRHFEVTVNGTNLALKIDGLDVTNWDSNAATAGYWGFTQNKQNTSYRIDNLVVTRADAANAVTLNAGEGGTLTAAIVTPGNTTGTALASGGTAYAGDTIKITGTKDGAVLNAVTVNGSADGVTKTPAEGGGYTYTFTMPTESVTVAGTFVPLIPEFTVSGADANGSISVGTIGEGDNFVGNTLAIQGELASDTDATFKWYKKTGDGAWTQITGAGNSSYTLKQSDYNSSTTTKLKVEVIGSGDHHAGSRESGEFTVTAPVYAVTGVTLHRSTLTMWTNYTPTESGEFPAEVGKSATLTATVAPGEVTGAEVTWTSDNAAVTVTKSTTNDYEATLTANSKGTANITVSVTAGGATKTATCAVEVKTRVETITVKNGETEIGEGGIVKVYLNDGDTEAPGTVTLVGTVAPTDANDKGLTWTRTSGDAGKINIQPVGGSDQDPNSATSSGSGVTISAVGTPTNVGEVTVKVAAHDGKGAEKTFKVQVWRKLAHEITIGGTLKYGAELEVNTDSLDMTAAGKAALTYAWSRTDKDGTVTTIKTGTGDTGKKYTLTADDVGCTITVTVTADATTFYDGSKSATTGTVELADGPAAPGLNATPVDGETKGSITITTVDGAKYEYRMWNTAENKWGEWTTENLDQDTGVISDLAVGNYQVRIQKTTTHKAGAAGTASVADATKVNHSVTVTTDPTTGAGTVELSANLVQEGNSVTLTVTPADGYDIESVKIGDDVQEGVAGTGRAKEYTVDSVTADVAFAVTFKKKTVTVTFALTHVTATCDEDETHENGGKHTVEYGVVHEITLEADAGWKLPAGITVTYTDPDVTDPSARWSYSQEDSKITFTYGVQKDITITVVADELEYSVAMATTGGHIDLEGDENTVKHGATFEGTLKVTDTANYELPDSLDSVTMGGEALTGTAYTYTSSTGEISIPNVTGDVVITATAKAKKTQLTGVTISILHNDGTGMGSGSENVPHVGDTLTATAAPNGATVTYQWFVGESTTAAGTSQTYTVKDTDLGKVIKVVVTGTGTFEGTEEATTNPVGAKTWRVSGVSLNKATTSLVFGEEETLTATVEPSTATNKKVTWSSDNENAATVDANGKVTAVGVGTATITVTTEDGGQTATCAVTVTAKALPALQITTPKVGETVRVTFAGGVSTNVATYEWYTGESNDAENGTWSRVADVSGASWEVAGVPDGRYIKVIAYAKSGENYTGSATVVSAPILSAGTLVETFDITVTKEGNGTVTVKVNDDAADRASEGDAVTIEVTGVATGATVEVTTTTEGVTLHKGTGNTWTFTMPAKAVEITVTITGGTAAEKYAVTVTDAENGTVTADKEEAAEGETVTLTVTPDEGYVLDSLTVTKAGGGAVSGTTVTDDTYTFEMPGEAVTVTATFVEDGEEPPVPPTVDIKELTDAIKAAQKLHDNVVVAANAEEVPSNKEFVTDEALKEALQTAIDAAKAVLDAAEDQETVDAAVEALAEAVQTFKDACEKGTKKVSTPVVVVPNNPTETKENEDGSVTTIETKPDGTVIETTEKPDGTVTEVVTEPDGTVTETTTQPDGAKVEKITDPEEGVSVTATNAEGEVVAEVKVPAVIPEAETRFEDVPEGHWADESIHKIAAMALVEGVGDNKYDMESDVTRGALATILHRMANKPAGSEVSFQDVLEDKYYTEGVAWAAKVGVVTGFSANTFKPEQTITREQLALMLMRYAKLLGMDVTANAEVLNAYSDGDTTHAWAAEGVAWCVQNGIILGKSEEILAPTDNVTRAQVAVMLDRFLALIEK